MAKNTIIKDALILFAITLVSGAALAFVYEITKEPIRKAELEKKLKAYKVVFETAEEFVENDEIKTKLNESSKYLLDNGFEGINIDEILCATNETENVGYVMTITTSKGYGGNITVALGILNDGTVNGMEILTINETAGLGMKAADESFLSQFTDKKVESFEYTKTGSSADNEIDALSGATITTSAVTEAVNAGISFVNNCLVAE